MDIIRDFMDKHFTTKVTEDKNGMKVIFESKVVSIDNGTIWFEKAKKGWNKKPLSTNTYIIVDADLTKILTFLSRYYNIREEHYHEVRKMFVDMGIKIMDEHLNPKKLDNL
jgi:hypothetical protein